MRRSLLIAVLLVMGVAEATAQLLPSFGRERTGTSGYQFLQVPADARSASLGQAVVATAGGASTLYWNPALAARADGVQAGFQHTAYFVDVAVDFVGVVYPVRGTNVSLGASLQTMNSGSMDVTTEFQPFGTGETFSLVDVAAGLTLAQRLTDLFSYGITGKYVRESVADVTASTVVFDLGFHYLVSSTGLTLAVALRNFGLEGTPKGRLSRPVIDRPSTRIETEFEALSPPTTFHLGASYDLLQSRSDQRLAVSVQLNNPSDNAENWGLGLEYDWNDLLFLRTGIRLGVEEVTTPAAGVGLRVPVSGTILRFDYGFDHLERLGSVHRMGVNIEL